MLCVINSQEGNDIT